MRIDESEDRQARLKRQDTIRQIQQYQEQQDAAELQEKAGDAGELKQLEQGDDVPDVAAQELSRDAAELGEAQQAGAEQRQDVAATQTSGAALTEQAAELASSQQDAGEGWQGFSSTGGGRELPTSVEELAREQDAHAEQDKESASARDLLNNLAIQQRHIKG